MTVISNTTVVSNFAAVNRLELLNLLFGDLHIPVGVYQEVLAGAEEGYLFNNAILQAISSNQSDGWLRLVSPQTEDELNQLAHFPRSIHRGEAECLTIAQNRGWLLLTDDRLARKLARASGISISGTLGCLAIAVERELISLPEGNALLNDMLKQGYRSPVRDLSDLL